MILKLSRICHAKTIEDNGDRELTALVFFVGIFFSLWSLTTMPKLKQTLQTHVLFMLFGGPA